MFVWFPQSALRADAVATRSGGEGGAAHVVRSMTAAALLTSTSLSHSAVSSSFHNVFLLVDVIHSPEPTTTDPRTAWHGKGVRIKGACEPSFDHVPQIAGHERNDSDAVGSDRVMQASRDGAAHQSADAQLRQTKRLLNRQFTHQHYLRFVDILASRGFHEVNLPGNVKNRRDSIVPCSECGFHRVRYIVWCLEEYDCTQRAKAGARSRELPKCFSGLDLSRIT